MTSTIERYHDVPVPEGALPEVYALLGDYAQRGMAPSTSSAEAGWLVPDNGEWTYEDLATLSSKLMNKAGRAILTEVCTATLDDRSATYGDLQAAATRASGEEFSLNQVRAQLSWIAKYCKAIKGHIVWPMTVRELDDKTLPRGHRYHYKSVPEVAAAWLEIVAEADQ
jgi:hypothetical protein